MTIRCLRCSVAMTFVTLIIGVASAQSIRFTDQSARIAIQGSGWHGVSVIDFDGDEWDDICIAGWTATLLYRNNRDLTFSNVTDQAGVSILNGGSNVAVFGDINNDGAPDLFVAGSGSRNRLFLNNGNGTFRDVTSMSGIDSTKQIVSAAFADIDNDGMIDLACSASGDDLLYRNSSSSSGTIFQDITFNAGVQGEPYTNPMQVTFVDYDHNGTQDLFFVYDGFEKSTLFRNAQTLPFQDVAPSAGIANVGRGNSMGVVWFDYNADGWEDAYITRIDSAGLYRNNRNGTFTEVAAAAGCDSNGMAWGVVADDFDNDGDEDLYISNTSGYGGKHPLAILYENLGGTFREVGASAGIAVFMDGKGVASGDFNNDGLRDVVAVDLATGKNLLYINSTPPGNNWVSFELRGTAVNRMAIGTRVRLVANGKSQVRTLTAGSSFSSQVSPILHFGLGQATQVDTLEVFWAPNAVQRHVGLPVNQRRTITQTVTGIDRREQPHVPRSLAIASYPNPFNPSTTINVTLPARARLRVTVTDLLGRVVTHLTDDLHDAGTLRLRLDAAGLPSGMYVCRAETSEMAATLPLLLLR